MSYLGPPTLVEVEPFPIPVQDEEQENYLRLMGRRPQVRLIELDPSGSRINIQVE